MPVPVREEYEVKEIYRNPGGFQDGHHADMMLLGCVDFRLWADVAKCFLQMNKKVDLRLTEGGIAYLCGHKHGLPDMHQGCVAWTKLLQSLHGFSEVGLMIHDDCGAYNNAPALKGKSREAIFAAQLQDLEEAERMLLAAIPTIKILKYHMVVDKQTGDIVIEELVAKQVFAEAAVV